MADFAGTTRERHEELVASETVPATNRSPSNDNREEPVDWLGDPLLVQLASIEIAATRCW